MRHILTTVRVRLVAAVAVVTLAACSGPEPIRSVFTVEGMHCESCSSAITTALEKMDGVIEASADHVEGTADAVYDPRIVEVETLKTEIEELGYTVTGVSTEAVES
jgi:copper chaperone CopZ